MTIDPNEFWPFDVVLEEVAEERMRQDEKWGEQNHPMRSGDWSAECSARSADGWKRINDLRQAAGELVWHGILLEEVYEALAETDPAKQREELIQVAAVAVAMIECLDRRQGV